MLVATPLMTAVGVVGWQLAELKQAIAIPTPIFTKPFTKRKKAESDFFLPRGDKK